MIEITDHEMIPNHNTDYRNLKVDVRENCILHYKDFFENYMLKNLPCVIKNINSTWECRKKWITNDRIDYNYIIDTYGQLEAPIVDCNNLIDNTHFRHDMKLEDYMVYLKSEKDKLLYLKDWHLRKLRPLDNFYEVPLLFASDWLNEYTQDTKDDDFMFVYIGPKGTWTPLHADVFNSFSWSVNVIGTKKWILFPPGEEKKLSDCHNNLPMLFDKEIHKDVKFLEVLQENGDAMFVPSGWYHQVVNLLDTISINHNWINGCNIDKMWNAFEKDLVSVENEIDALKETEEFSIQCQIILKKLFGMDFKMFTKFVCHIGNKRLKQLESNTHKSFGNYNLGTNHIAFDLNSVSKTIDKIVNHPIFINKDIISYELQNELLTLKHSIKDNFK